MAVEIGEADGDHVALCACSNCGARFETDETMTNDCPECSQNSLEIIDGVATNPEMTWRDGGDA